MNYLYIIFLLLLLLLLTKKNLETFDVKVEPIFPFRYLKDENNNKIPIVVLAAPFRKDEDKERYSKFLENNIIVIGITAYKSFPKKITDQTEGTYHLNDDFDYMKNIPIWLSCLRDNSIFTNNIIENISESDFYDIDLIKTNKIYDFIYICNKDNDSCPLNGWNAINRNFNLALKCFPIMINEYKLKCLCVGRIGCNLEALYGNNIEITDFLNYHELQNKMRQSRFLFVPNIYDASPRVVAECLIKNVPVLMNESIKGGHKYMDYNTGEFFNDEHDIRTGLDNLLKKINIINPQEWWKNNYGIEKSSIKLRNFLYNYYPNILENIKKVSFII